MQFEIQYTIQIKSNTHILHVCRHAHVSSTHASIHIQNEITTIAQIQPLLEP